LGERIWGFSPIRASWQTSISPRCRQSRHGELGGYRRPTISDAVRYTIEDSWREERHLRGRAQRRRAGAGDADRVRRCQLLA
jgi:hypothetical protein